MYIYQYYVTYCCTGETKSANQIAITMTHLLLRGMVNGQLYKWWLAKETPSMALGYQVKRQEIGIKDQAV